MGRRIHLDVVSSENGLVVAPDLRAADAGAAMLRAGGNAVDAAVAACFAIGVVEPFMSGLGGGTWMVAALRQPEPRVVIVDGSVLAPGAGRPDMFSLAGGQPSGLYGWPRVVDDANIRGGSSIGVPGTVSALCRSQEQLGVLELAQVLAPAIELADNGSDVNWFCSAMTTLEMANLRRDDGCASIFLPQGLPLRGPGLEPPDRLNQSALARTLAEIAREGEKAFYLGPIASSIVSTVRGAGGVMTLADLENYAAKVDAPVSEGAYGDWRIIGPYGTGAGTVIQALQLFAAAGRPESPPERASAWATALRLSFEDRFDYMSANTSERHVTDELLAEDYTLARFEADRKGRSRPIPPSASGTNVTSGGAPRKAGCTSHITAVDQAGNVVSVTQTLLDLFGARVLDPETGVLLNDGMMWFDPRPGRAASVRPGAPGMTAASPILLLRQGRAIAALGASGGRRVISSVAQLAAGVMDCHGSLQALIEAPRLHVEARAAVLDVRFPPEVVERLQAGGYEVTMAEEEPTTWHFGRPNGVVAENEGGWSAGLDPNKPGAAVSA
jgi:gamma-glutamyltranspeptidase/glutathione hydrolase